MVAIHVPCVCCHHAGTYQIYRILAWCTCVATDNINFYPDLRKTTNFVLFHFMYVLCRTLIVQVPIRIPIDLSVF